MWNKLPEHPTHTAMTRLLARYWQAKPNTLRHISRSANDVYRFVGSDDRIYYARLTHDQIRPHEVNEGALHFQQFLAEQGIATPVPVYTRDRRLAVPLGNGYYLCVIEEGKGRPLNTAIVDAMMMHQWGVATAEFHQASRCYTPKPTAQYHYVMRQWSRLTPIVQRAEPVIRDAYMQMTPRLLDLKRDETYHLIHGDYHAGNILASVSAKGWSLTLIDFDEPVYHWAIADMARVMLEFYDRPVSVRCNLRDAFLDGYRSVLPMPDYWVDQLPFFMQMRGILMHLWTMEDDLPPDSDGHDSPFQQARDWAITRYEF